MNWRLSCCVLLSAVGFLCTAANALYLDAASAKASSGKVPASVKDVNMFRAVERTMLATLGLSSRPNPSTTLRVPEYMRNLYDSHAQHPDWISTKFRFNGEWMDANTARGCFHKEEEVVKFPDLHNKGILSFNVTMPKHEKVTGADLRLWKEKYSSDEESELSYRVNIYQVLRPVQGTSAVITRLIHTKLVNASFNGWLTFDVKSAVQHWLTHPLENYGLEVELVTKDGHHIDSPVLHLARSMNDEAWHDRRPLLVTFAHDETRHTHVRRKRAATGGGSANPQNPAGICKRHRLYVDFKDVGWDDWIVAPPGYQAYFCKGVCPFPLTNHMNATNHAVVQNLVNSVQPNAAPKACCVPTRLTPISMLYLDNQSKVVLKIYQEMVVDGCGCR